MQLHQLKAFVCAADSGSISAAARMLGLTQPTLTRSLRQLELAVGATLMKRGVTGVVLTEAGQSLLEHARQIVEEVRRAQEHVRQSTGDTGGQVCIACSAVPAQALLAHAVSLMRSSFPNVQLQVSSAVYPAVLQLFRTARIDFAVGPVPPQGLGPDYQSEVIMQTCFVPVVRPGHPQGDCKQLADLGHLSWIAAGPSAGPGDACHRAFAAAGLSAPTIAASSETVETALHLIARADWACFIPEPLARDASRRGIVCAVPVENTLPELQISLFRPAKRILTPAGQALYSAIRSASRRWPADPTH
jgi:LysR family transcriptional regulator, regulator of abg operon